MFINMEFERVEYTLDFRLADVRVNRMSFLMFLEFAKYSDNLQNQIDF